MSRAELVAVLVALAICVACTAAVALLYNLLVTFIEVYAFALDLLTRYGVPPWN